MPFEKEKFLSKIHDKSIKIGVIGLGKMGLPISLVFSNAGFEVNGYDISLELVDNLNKGRSNLDKEPFVNERLMSSIENNSFKAHSELNEKILTSDVIIVIVPILNHEDGSQNLENLISLYRNLSNKLMNDVLFVQESTLAPGTCEKVLWPIISKEINKQNSLNFGLVFAPERTFSGRVIEDIETNYPKIVGGIYDEHAIVGQALYEKVAKKGVIKVKNATTAEAIKTFKGAYRDINIAIANQFAKMADKYNIDIIEIIDVANTEPYSNIHMPGLGVGGHCIPVYPKFLINSGLEYKFDADLLINARNINDSMVKYCVDTLKNIKIQFDNLLILGVAYRGGVKEYRNSPSIRLVPELMKNFDIEIKIADPLYHENELKNIFNMEIGISFNELNIDSFDAIVICTDHDEFRKINFGKTKANIIFDGRYVVEDSEVGDKLIIQPGRFFKIK